VSTRRLIITALVCGMAILLAGGIFLVRVAGSQAERTVAVHAVGDPVRVADLTVTVDRSIPSATAYEVVVTVDATAAAIAFPTDAETPWSLLVRTARDRLAPSSAVAPCRGQQIRSGDRLTCALAFGAGDGPAYLAFDWRGATLRWRL
jgi:hypothetical protein